MKSKVYTLTGDKGTTALVGGKRVAKDCVRVEAYGTVDELNSNIGLLIHDLPTGVATTFAPLLHKVQCKLFNIGAYLATEPTDDGQTVYGLCDNDVTDIEHAIDEMDAKLPTLKGFILPGGCQAACRADVCRTIARRAERRTVTLARESIVSPLALKFLNRLSDFFFVFARFNNMASQIDEIYWDKNC